MRAAPFDGDMQDATNAGQVLQRFAVKQQEPAQRKNGKRTLNAVRLKNGIRGPAMMPNDQGLTGDDRQQTGKERSNDGA